MKQLKIHWYYADKDTSIFLSKQPFIKNDKILTKFIFRDLKFKSQGKRIKIIKYIAWEDVEEPSKGDTPA